MNVTTIIEKQCELFNIRKKFRSSEHYVDLIIICKGVDNGHNLIYEFMNILVIDMNNV